MCKIFINKSQLWLIAWESDTWSIFFSAYQEHQIDICNLLQTDNWLYPHHPKPKPWITAHYVNFEFLLNLSTLYTQSMKQGSNIYGPRLKNPHFWLRHYLFILKKKPTFLESPYSFFPV